MKILKHKNSWVWGKSTIIVLEDGLGIVTISFENDNPDEATITGLSVHESARRRGLGTELVRLAEEEARDNGAKRVVLFSDENTFTYKWYQSLGYEKAFDRFYLDSPEIKELAKKL